MHLLLIHQAFASPNEAGGTRHFELGRHWVERGNRFTIVASNISYLTGSTVRPKGPGETESYSGVRVLRVRAAPTLHRSFVWRVFSFLGFMLSSVAASFRAGPVDVVMGTSPPIFQAISAWFVALVRRRPFVMEVRDLWPEFAVDMGILKNPALIRLLTWLAAFLHTRARVVVVNSPAYRDHLVARGIPAEKIHLVANGVDASMFDPSADGAALREELGLVGKFVVTYAGALGVANDIPVLLRAMKRLGGESDIHLLLVGDGKERRNLERMSEELGSRNVTFAGARPKTEVPAILAMSDACAATLRNIPMFRMTYPNKVFDYMAAGRPTLLGIDGVIREVVDAADGGIFVPPGDDAAMARAILALRDDPERARAMGRSARAYVEREFDRGRQAEQFRRLIEDTVSSGE